MQVTNLQMVVVDYSRSFSQMISTYNNGGKVSEYFPRSLSISGEGCVLVETAIFDFGDEYVLEADIRSAMEAEGYRCARVEELLAFGESSPEEQRVKAIVALGTRFQGGSRTQSVAYLYESSGKRYLGEYAQPVKETWRRNFRFLGVRM